MQVIRELVCAGFAAKAYCCVCRRVGYLREHVGQALGTSIDSCTTTTVILSLFNSLLANGIVFIISVHERVLVGYVPRVPLNSLATRLPSIRTRHISHAARQNEVVDEVPLAILGVRRTLIEGIGEGLELGRSTHLTHNANHLNSWHVRTKCRKLRSSHCAREPFKHREVGGPPHTRFCETQSPCFGRDRTVEREVYTVQKKKQITAPVSDCCHAAS